MRPMKKLLDFDPVTRSRTAFHANDDEIVLHEVVDVSPVTEENKALYAAADERARWGDGMGDRVASIPASIYWRKVHMEGMSNKDLLKWLDHPDQRVFRTRPGKLS